MEGIIMKTIFKHFGIIALAALAACVSCTKEENGVDPGQKNGLRTLSISVDLATKVNSVGPTFQWDAAEDHLSVIGLVDGSPRMYKFTKAAGSKSTEATFTSAVEIPASAQLLYAVYPYNSDYNWDGTGDLSLTLKNVQSCYDNGGVSAFPLMAGKISNNSVTLKQVCSFLKFTLPARSGSASYVRSIYVRGTGIAGNVDVDFSGDDPVASAGDAEFMRVGTKNEGAKYGDVYVPVLPGIYSSLEIELEYTDGHSNYVRTTNSSNTLVRGKYKDLGTASGPFVVSTGVSSATLDGTTLSLSGTANVWKYFGVDNSKYTFKFAYKDSEAEDIAANWTEVDADSPTGDGNTVTFTKDVTVTAGKTYNVKAVVVASGVTSESTEETTAAKSKKTVTINAATNDDFANFVYSTPTKSGYHIIVNESGEPIFPILTDWFKGKAKEYDGSAFGESYNFDGELKLFVGGTLTKDGCEFVIPQSNRYYVRFNNAIRFRVQHGFQIVCPSGHTITKITLNGASDPNFAFNWGLNTAFSLSGFIVTPAAITEAPFKYEWEISPKVAGQSYWVISGTSQCAFTSLEVEYEY